jgi:CHAT domain-containing protein/tetratricopeptide (TPR) repeat protein
MNARLFQPHNWLVLCLVFVLSTASSLAAQTEKGRAQQLMKEGEELWNQWAFAPALEKLEAALKLSEQLSEPKLMARCLNLMGGVSDSQRNYDLGLERHQRALTLAREINDQPLEGAILADIGLGYWRQANYAPALDYCQQALTIQEQIGDHLGRAKTLVYIGRVHFKQGAYEQALENHHRALTIQEGAGNRLGQSVTLEDLGDVYHDQGAYAQALEYFQRALQLREEIEDWAGQCDMLKVIGVCYLNQGAYLNARDHFLRALALAQKFHMRPGRASALYHLGLVYSRQGDYAKALACYQGALQIREEMGDRYAQAQDLADMGSVYYSQGDVTQALTYYQRAIRMWEEIRDRRNLAGGLHDIGEVYDKLGDDQQALEYYRRALKLGEEIRLPYLSLTLGNIGRIYARHGEAEQALQYGQRAVEYAEQINNAGMQWDAAYRLGTIQCRLGLRAEALQSFRDSLTIIERLRADVASVDEAKAGFLEDKQIVYAATISLLLELGRTDEALELAERARARAFLDLLGGRELQAKPTDAGLLARIRRLQDKLQPRPPVKASAERVDRDITMRGGDLVKAELSKLQQEQPELASLISVQPLTLAQLREEARRRQATVVEYYSADDQLFIWVIEPGGVIWATSSKIRRRDLDHLVQMMRRAMRVDWAARDWDAEDPDPRTEQQDLRMPAQAVAKPKGIAKPTENHYRSALRRLYRILIAPIERWLPQEPTQLVTIIPHGRLFLVSFAALLDEHSRYFIERHTLNYSPAISVLQYTESKKRRVVHQQPPQLLVVGNPAMPRLPGRPHPLAPLPGAEIEARAISRLYPARQVTTLTGSQAQEGLVRELAPGQTIIHLATHGIIRDDEPLESLLALAPEIRNQKPETGSRWSEVHSRPSPTTDHGPRTTNNGSATGDGLLTVREVFQLDLNADLVVLSACNTGLGQIRGEGVIGLSRAFIYAGTPSVMVSLWRVADVVAKSEMERFYRALKRNGGNKAAALREAQLEILRRLRQSRLRTPSGQPLREHPIFWAPFILIGEAR